MGDRARRAPPADPIRTGIVANVLQEARASLANPSRPFTPAESTRRLFPSGDYGIRPPSVQSVSSATFLDGALNRSLSFRGVPSPLTTPPITPRRLDHSASSPRQPQRPPAPVAPPAADQGRPVQPPDVPPRRPRPPVASEPGPTPPTLPPRKPPTPKSSSAEARPTPSKSVPGAAAPGSRGAEPQPPSSSSASADGLPVALIQSTLAGLDPARPPATLLQTCETLWGIIEPLGERIRERGPGSRRESAGEGGDADRPADLGGDILRAIYKLMDQKEPRLLARLCRIILRITRSSSSVLNTCRVMYKLSKEDRNDALFRDEGLAEALLLLARDPHYSGGPDASSQSDDIMLYAAGALKNTSNDDANARHILQKGGVAALGFILTTRCAALAAMGPPAEGSRPGSASGGSERVAQLLVQVTASVRNLAAQPLGGVHRRHFLAAGVLDSLLALTGLLPGHAEAMLNVSRVLSKLTLYEDCRAAVTRYPDGTRRLLGLLARHPDNVALVTRVCFVLGNLTTASEASRALLGGPLAAPDTLLPVLSRYAARDAALAPPPPAPSPPPSTSAPPRERPLQPPQVRESEEALVKIIRLVANLSIEGESGARVAARPEVDELVRILERKSISTSEELVLNAVSAITNLSFHIDPDNRVLAARCHLARLLVPLLLSFNEEAVVESLRAFGNFSRHEDVRAALADSRVSEIGVVLLDHGSRDVVYWAAGVLLNLAADDRHRSLLRECGGVDRLLDALGRFGTSDYALSATVCKALANYCMGEGGLTGEEAASLSGLLDDLAAAAAAEGREEARRGCDAATDTAEDGRGGGPARASPAPGRPPSRGRGSSGEEGEAVQVAGEGPAAAGVSEAEARAAGRREFLEVAADLADIVRQQAALAGRPARARLAAGQESPPPPRELVPLEYHSDSSRTDRSTS